MARIAVATFQHETNTFAPSRAGFDAFEAGGGWPGYMLGGEILDMVADKNIPISGFMDAARRLGHRPVPLVFANATPSAHVTTEAFERIMGDLLRSLAKVSPVDAVYLDLHGAMVCEAQEDGEGEILARVRKAVGEHVPIVASLDLHANVSDRMFDIADGLIAYRTYPHVDMAYTGTRVADLLEQIIKRQERPAKAIRRLDFLIPLTAQCTLIQPADRIYGEIARAEAAALGSLSFAPGFPAADVPCCAPSVFGMGFDRTLVEAEVARLAADIAAQEGDFHTEFLSADSAVVEAMMLARTARGPVILADTQDNPGAGGNGDTTGLLTTLIARRAPGALLGLLIDSAAARRAHQAGVGAEVDFSLGAKSGLKGHFPVVGRFRVERLGDGDFTCKGPFYKGARMSLGPMAALRKDDVTVVVASRKVQAADQEMFRHLLIEPMEKKIIVLKSSVHFRAHFGPIAEKVLVVAAPGPVAANPETLPWRRLRPGIRLRPFGRAFMPAAG
jgi:microcystin degradation protein MlrC